MLETHKNPRCASDLGSKSAWVHLLRVTELLGPEALHGPREPFEADHEVPQSKSEMSRFYMKILSK